MASDDLHRPAPALLSPTDPPPVSIVNPDGPSPFLLIGDHAGNVIPRSLGSLGLGDDDLGRHIAWDIGVGPLGETLAADLDAVFVRQSYSRLVVDCNRRPDAPDAIPAVSDGTPIPGNAAVTEATRSERIDLIHAPYQQAIAREIERRAAAGRATVLIALHSFTPRLRGGGDRPWQIGILHDQGDPSFARRLLLVLREDGALVVGDNEPYRMDMIDYTIPRHAYAAGIPYAEIELRQDLIADAAGQAAWRRRLVAALTAALAPVAA